MRIGSASGIAGCGDSSLILPVPDVETLPFLKGSFETHKIILLFLSAFMFIFLALRYACHLYLLTPTR